METQDLVKHQQAGQEEEDRKSEERPRSADSIGAEAALRRAAIKARRRAIETSGSVPTWKDGKIVYETEV